jgi:SIR2-like domain
VPEIREPPWRILAEKLLRGGVIPFLGAGASCYATSSAGEGPPSGASFAADLASRAGISIACPTLCGNNGCHNHCDRPLFDLPRITSYYQSCADTRPNLDLYIKDTICSANFVPTPLHRLLAKIASRRPLLIITTNYDALLERAFDEFNADDDQHRIEYDVVATPADLLSYEDSPEHEAPEYAGAIWVRDGRSREFEPKVPQDVIVDLTRKSLIYKIHGSVGDETKWAGGFLIAEEDYVRFLGRMGNGGIIPQSIFSEMRRMTGTLESFCRSYESGAMLPVKLFTMRLCAMLAISTQNYSGSAVLHRMTAT